MARLPKRDARRVRDAVKRLAHGGGGNIKRLRGRNPPAHGLRVGDWRAILEIQPGEIGVKRVFHRREAYRKSSGIRQAVPSEEELPHWRGDEDGWETGERARPGELRLGDSGKATCGE